MDNCFKIYNPVKGSASVRINGRNYDLDTQYIYFISGFDIEYQSCTSSMDIYWLHINPSSLYLKYILLKTEPIKAWKKSQFPFLDDMNRNIEMIFKNDDYLSSNIKNIAYTPEEARLNSYVLIFISELLSAMPEDKLNASKEITRIQASLEYINKEYKANPSLEKIASRSSLAPNYFHRIFKKNFGVTPHHYMLRLRMEEAVRLLTSTNNSIKDIAFETGYSNEFYFYRQFKKYYNYSPGKLKKLRPF